MVISFRIRIFSGLENEGWFDPWALLSAFKKKAISLGAKYIHAEAIGFEMENISPYKGEASTPIFGANYVYVSKHFIFVLYS